MIFSFYELANLTICLIITIFVVFRYQLSNKILILLIVHLLLIVFMDLLIDPHYMPDQFRYYETTKAISDGSAVKTSDTVYNAGLYFSWFPLFIDSIKSIAFINYLLYLFIFIYVLKKLHDPQIIKIFKIFYFFYPALILYTSTGGRDTLIILFMFLSLYFLLCANRYIFSIVIATAIYPIKFQNYFLILITILFYFIEKIKNRNIKIVMYISVILIAILNIAIVSDDLSLLRGAFFTEDTGLSPVYILAWTPLDLYRFYFAPFFFDARNIMQMLQSCENLALCIFVYKMIKLRKNIIPDDKKRVIDGFFIVASIIYSYVVFNYGTITRYKFPFVVCWVLINLLWMDSYKTKNAMQNINERK
jgi:hypothetical protein